MKIIVSSPFSLVKAQNYVSLKKIFSMRHLIKTLIFYVVLPLTAFSQQTAEIRFGERTHDFGTIRMDDSPFLHEFVFLNDTGDTLQIEDVKASCGCTVPGWTRNKIAPGDSGRVSAQYNADRSGTFSKSLQVKFAGRSEAEALHVQGRVIPASKSPVELLPTSIGNLNIKYRSVNLGKVLTTEEPSQREFEIYNNGTSPLYLDSAWHSPYAEVTFVPDTLQPAELGKLVVRYDAAAVNDLGFRSENITLFTNDSIEAEKSLNLYATVAEYFPPMTEEELKQAAHLRIDKSVYDFDNIETDSSYTAEFTVRNSGQSLLSIRKLEVNCSCIRAKADKMEIKPGKEATITVTFDTTERLGNQQKSVTIYTNDPIAPAQRLILKAYIPVSD
jgi:hypothetical protein